MNGVGKRRWYAAAGAFGLLLAAGCSSGSDSGTGSRATAPVLPAQPNAATSSQPSSSTSSPTTPALPELPAAARERSFAGAEAFVRHFVDTYSRAAAAGEAGVLTPYFAKSCKTCQQLEKVLATGVARRERFDRPPVSVHRVTVLNENPATPDEFQATVELLELSNTVRAKDGSVVQRIPQSRPVSSFTIRWMKDRWLVASIITVDSKK